MKKTFITILVIGLLLFVKTAQAQDSTTYACDYTTKTDDFWVINPHTYFIGGLVQETPDHEIDCAAMNPNGEFVAIQFSDDHYNSWVMVYKIRDFSTVYSGVDHWSPVWNPSHPALLYVLDNDWKPAIIEIDFSVDNHPSRVIKSNDDYTPLTVSADGTWLFSSVDNLEFTRVEAVNLVTGFTTEVYTRDLWRVTGLTPEGLLLYTSYFCGNGEGQLSRTFESQWGTILMPFDYQTGKFSNSPTCVDRKFTVSAQVSTENGNFGFTSGRVFTEDTVLRIGKYMENQLWLSSKGQLLWATNVLGTATANSIEVSRLEDAKQTIFGEFKVVSGEWIIEIPSGINIRSLPTAEGSLLSTSSGLTVNATAKFTVAGEDWYMFLDSQGNVSFVAGWLVNTKN